MAKKYWAVAFLMFRQKRGEAKGRLCGYLPVFETREAALRWADGKAEVLALVGRAEYPDA